MTSQEARALFDAALDRELPDDVRAEFERALAEDASLRAEFERHGSLLAAADQLGRVSSVDLLAGVQHKLRARSGGKFYRDRFAARRDSSLGLGLVLALSGFLVLSVLLWLAYDAGLFAAPG